MIEISPGGIIPILDEECIRPGEDDDRRVLMHMNKKLSDHAHYSSNATGVKELQREVEFRVCMLYTYGYKHLCDCASENHTSKYAISVLHNCMHKIY